MNTKFQSKIAIFLFFLVALMSVLGLIGNYYHFHEIDFDTSTIIAMPLLKTGAVNLGRGHSPLFPLFMDLLSQYISLSPYQLLCCLSVLTIIFTVFIAGMVLKNQRISLLGSLFFIVYFFSNYANYLIFPTHDDNIYPLLFIAIGYYFALFQPNLNLFLKYTIVVISGLLSTFLHFQSLPFVLGILILIGIKDLKKMKVLNVALVFIFILIIILQRQIFTLIKWFEVGNYITELSNAEISYFAIHRNLLENYKWISGFISNCRLLFPLGTFQWILGNDKFWILALLLSENAYFFFSKTVQKNKFILSSRLLFYSGLIFCFLLEPTSPERWINTTFFASFYFAGLTHLIFRKIKIVLPSIGFVAMILSFFLFFLYSPNYLGYDIIKTPNRALYKCIAKIDQSSNQSIYFNNFEKWFFSEYFTKKKSYYGHIDGLPEMELAKIGFIGRDSLNYIYTKFPKSKIQMTNLPYNRNLFETYYLKNCNEFFYKIEIVR